MNGDRPADLPRIIDDSSGLWGDAILDGFIELSARTLVSLADATGGRMVLRNVGGRLDRAVARSLAERYNQSAASVFLGLSERQLRNRLREVSDSSRVGELMQFLTELRLRPDGMSRTEVDSLFGVDTLKSRRNTRETDVDVRTFKDRHAVVERILDIGSAMGLFRIREQGDRIIASDYPAEQKLRDNITVYLLYRHGVADEATIARRVHEPVAIVAERLDRLARSGRVANDGDGRYRVVSLRMMPSDKEAWPAKFLDFADAALTAACIKLAPEGGSTVPASGGPPRSFISTLRIHGFAGRQAAVDRLMQQIDRSVTDLVQTYRSTPPLEGASDGRSLTVFFGRTCSSTEDN